jgi:hypothetical protein
LYQELNIRSETLKLLEENIGKTLKDIGIDNVFLNRATFAQEIRARIDKWDCINLKSFYAAKKLIIQFLILQLVESKDNLQDGRKSSPAIRWIKD